jgi:hypothetical protein
MGWSTVMAHYGAPEHEAYMRDGFEPFSVIPMSAGVNPITRVPEVAFMVFFKKLLPEGEVANAKPIENTEPPSSLILS